MDQARPVLRLASPLESVVLLLRQLGALDLARITDGLVHVLDEVKTVMRQRRVVRSWT